MAETRAKNLFSKILNRVAQPQNGLGYFRLPCRFSTRMKSLWKFLLILLFVIFEGFAADPFAENVRTASLFQSDWKMLETRLNAGINELDDKSMGAFLKKDLSPNVLTNTSFLVEM